jgi:hypothetical protein
MYGRDLMVRIADKVRSCNNRHPLQVQLAAGNDSQYL